ncbi:hypothetical protein Tco_1271069 [Tanacetum coccineum]
MLPDMNTGLLKEEGVVCQEGVGKMGRDTIQLEDAVSTISQDYLLEFSSEYFIPENLHPELPGPEDHIVDFPEGK